MVNSAEDFEYFVCKTEIEALTLENTLIKQYSPKYNIKLKDAKSYPYIKITDGKYPRLVFTRTRGTNKEKYFGPFSGASTAYSILDIIHKSLGIPNCKRVFPRDIGKERPCIYYQMKKCCGVCTGNVSEEEYSELIRCAAEILRGHSREAIQKLTEQIRGKKGSMSKILDLGFDDIFKYCRSTERRVRARLGGETARGGVPRRREGRRLTQRWRE
jgi:excinuclease ABC subunit C